MILPKVWTCTQPVGSGTWPYVGIVQLTSYDPCIPCLRYPRIGTVDHLAAAGILDAFDDLALSDRVQRMRRSSLLYREARSERQ